MKKLIVMLLCVALVSANFVVSADALPTEMQTDVSIETVETLIPCDATVDDNFVAGEILVGIKSAYSAVNKIWNASDFPELTGITLIEDLTYASNEAEISKYNDVETFNQLLKFYITNMNKQAVIDGINALQHNEKVLFAQPNGIYTAIESPGFVGNSVSTFATLSLNNTSRYKSVTNDEKLLEQKGIYLHNIDKAWNAFTVGSRSVTVGIVDSGISLHEDLSANLLTGYDCVAQSNDLEYNYAAPHGTTVASVVGAVGNNGKGITGVCQQVSLKSLQVGYQSGLSDATDEYVSRAILKAIVLNIPIINISLLYTVYDDPIAITSANMYSGLIVVSAGNAAKEITTTTAYSQLYDMDNVIVVGAIDSSKNICYYAEGNGSNYSSTYVDIMALGVGSELQYCIPNNQYSTTSDSSWGTSLSSPMVAGVAALLLSYDSTLTATQLKQYILNGAATTNSLREYCVNGRYLDAYGAFLAMENDATNSINVLIEPHFETVDGYEMLAYKYDFQFYYDKNYVRLSEVKLCESLYNDLYNRETDDEPVTAFTFTTFDSNGKTYINVSLEQLYGNITTNNEPLIEFHFISYSSVATAKSNIVFTTQNIYDYLGNPLTRTSNIYKKIFVGDVNGDSVITLDDSNKVLSYVVGKDTITGDYLLAANVTGDLLVNSTDSLWIQHYCNGTLKSFY